MCVQCKYSLPSSELTDAPCHSVTIFFFSLLWGQPSPSQQISSTQYVTVGFSLTAALRSLELTHLAWLEPATPRPTSPHSGSSGSGNPFLLRLLDHQSEDRGGISWRSQTAYSPPGWEHHTPSAHPQCREPAPSPPGHRRVWTPWTMAKQQLHSKDTVSSRSMVCGGQLPWPHWLCDPRAPREACILTWIWDPS